MPSLGRSLETTTTDYRSGMPGPERTRYIARSGSGATPGDDSDIAETPESLAEKLVQHQQALAMYAAGLAAIESSTIWRASYPYRWLIIHLRRIWQRADPEIAPDALPNAPINTPCAPTPHPIDVIIPIYRGLGGNPRLPGEWC
jgi:hypothetical protein